MHESDERSEHAMDMDAPAWLHDVQDAAERARRWAVANPFAALGVALAAGFLVGRATRRLG